MTKSITTLQTFTLEMYGLEIETQAMFRVNDGYTCRNTAVFPIYNPATAEMIGELQYLDGTLLTSKELEAVKLALGLSDSASLYAMLEAQVLERPLDFSDDGQYDD